MFQYFISFYLFFFGLCLGSFLNVLVDRGERGKSLRGRSKCDFCGYQLKWFDNIPVLSFFLLGGKCRKCRKKLSFQYPIVELAMGLAFLFLGHQVFSNQIFFRTSFQQFFFLLFLVFSIFFLAAVFLWDLKYMVIPDALIWSGLIVSILFRIFSMIFWNHNWLDKQTGLISGFLGALATGGFFGALWFFSKGKWIGLGDVKLGLWLGMLVGVQLVYPATMVSYILGALVAIFLLWRNKKKMSSQVPFGPFLVLGFLISFFWGSKMIEWIIQ